MDISNIVVKLQAQNNQTIKAATLNELAKLGKNKIKESVRISNSKFMQKNR